MAFPNKAIKIMKDFKVYLIGPNPLDSLSYKALVGWKGRNEVGDQIGAVMPLPPENIAEFIDQLVESGKILAKNSK